MNLNYKKEALKTGLINRFCFVCESCCLSDDDSVICEETQTWIDTEFMYETIGSMQECPRGKW